MNIQNIIHHGYVIEIYNNGKYNEIVHGNRQLKPIIKDCNKNTLYDIASITKTYTATLCYIAYEENKIDIYDYVKNIDERFAYLDNVRVIDLLSHNQEIWTEGYLGNAKNKEDFYKILFSAKIKKINPTYVDSHYIILSTLLEKIYNKSFNLILKDKIFDKLGLKYTTINPICDNIASNNYETLNGEVIDYIYPRRSSRYKSKNSQEIWYYNWSCFNIYNRGRIINIFEVIY